MHMLRATVCLAALSAITFAPPTSHAAPMPTVVELFTSQGCSSCPPADALLGELAKRNDVLALAYHINYWDDLGWRDRFASADATQRQYRYAKTLKLSGAFTPQAVVNGEHSLVGSDRRSLLNALSSVPAAVNVSLHVDAQNIVIDVSNVLVPKLDLVCVAYLRSADTVIPHGENAGRTLKEFNIVRAIKRFKVVNGEAMHFELPRSEIPSEATHVAVLAQRPDQGAIVGAAQIEIK